MISGFSKTAHGVLWGVTTYFNPAGYVNKYDHLALFARAARRQGLKLAIVELAFNDGPFVVNDNLADMIIRVRSSTVLWQKERLLNIAIEKLPSSCQNVAWLDGDILFGNSSWVDETLKALERFMVVQPYDVAWWLPPDRRTRPRQARANDFLFIMHGFAFTKTKNLNSAVRQGHCGFAWAARRNLIEAHGFYDRLILGGADLAMACSMYNDPLVTSSQASLEELCSPAQIKDVLLWKNRFFDAVRGNVGYVSGPVYHLWHGAHRDRNYSGRYRVLKDADFDPTRDLAIDSQGCWKWNSQKPGLHSQVREYFWSRQEDRNNIALTK